MTAARFECPRCQTVFVKDTGGEAAFVECPSCGALALPGGDSTNDALARAMSGAHHGPGNLETVADQPALSSDPNLTPGLSDPGFMPGTGAGVFSGLLVGGDPSGPAPRAPGPMPPPPPPETLPPQAASDAPARSESLDFDFGKDVDIDFGNLPVTSPVVSGAARAGGPFTTPTSTPRTTPRTTPSSTPWTAPRTTPTSTPRSTAGGVHALAPDALAALSDLDAEAPEGAARPAAWGGITDEAFGDLEKAFDEMALRPQPKGGRGKALTDDEAAFLRGGGETTDPGGPAGEGPTGRRAAPPRPPPRRSTKPSRARPQHLTLSDDAKRLAFLPLRADAPRRRVEDFIAAEPRLERHLEVVAARSVSPETTDLVREKKPEPPRVVPSPFAGLSLLRIAGIVLFATILGAVGGFFLTPQPQRPNTPRARAELKLADGNRFYQEGRFDDALGKFREAVNTDATFAPAHRAKGAALAKLQRWDESADAYKKYIELEPSALDAADAKEAIARREKKP